MGLPVLDPTCLIREDAPRVATRRVGRTSLFEHQRAMVYAMTKLEESPVRLDARTVAHTTVGVLCDPVGTGKSMSVLTLVANFPRLRAEPVEVPLRSARVENHAFLSVWERRTFVAHGSLNLLVVPSGGVFRQWQEYARNAEIAVVAVDTRKRLHALEKAEGIEELNGATLVLLSSTLFREFAELVERQGLTFHRVIVDEADSIKIPNMRSISAGMYWLVTSSWRNLAFYTGLVPVFEGALRTYHRCEGVAHHGFVRDVCRNLLQDYEAHTRFLFLSCDPDFLRASFTLPPVTHHSVLCRTPVNAVAGLHRLVSAEVASLIHAGDIEGAVARLGCSTATDLPSLAHALTEHTRARREERAARLTYARSVYGEADPRCAEIEEQIVRLDEEIASIDQRCRACVDEDVCPVCYDTPGTDGPLCATRCCAKVFCLNCLQKSLGSTRGQCAMCRARIEDTSQLVVMLDHSSSRPERFRTKEDCLVELIERHPQGRFLVFSMHDRTFSLVTSALDARGVTHSRLSGNTHHLAAKLRRFESGELRVLLMNATHFGQGYNLQSASHVVLFHRMSGELTDQIVGRAQRVGRTESLQVVHLLHVGE